MPNIATEKVSSADISFFSFTYMRITLRLTRRGNCLLLKTTHVKSRSGVEPVVIAVLCCLLIHSF